MTFTAPQDVELKNGLKVVSMIPARMDLTFRRDGA